MLKDALVRNRKLTEGDWLDYFYHLLFYIFSKLFNSFLNGQIKVLKQSPRVNLTRVENEFRSQKQFPIAP